MYDHERSLVTKMENAGEPFKLIGVNVNDELETIQKAVKEKDLNWRSFFMGEDMTTVDAYKVQGFPTIYLIDAEGKVRHISHGTVDKEIDELLAEMKEN